MAQKKVMQLFPRAAAVYNAAEEQKQNVIGQRIAQARKDAKLSLKSFSELLSSYGVDVAVGAINKWELGASKPSAYQLLAICFALNIPGQLEYFVGNYQPRLNSEGERKVKEYAEDLVLTGKYKPKSASTIISFKDMPVVNQLVSAGTGNILDEGSFDYVSYPESSIPPRAKFGIRISGDSMEPVYKNGQVVWVEPCEEIRPGEVGVFVYDGEGYIKSYGEQTPPEDVSDLYTDSYGTEHLQPVLISYNEKYPPKAVLPGVPFKIIGRVL